MLSPGIYKTSLISTDETDISGFREEEFNVLPMLGEGALALVYPVQKVKVTDQAKPELVLKVPKVRGDKSLKEEFEILTKLNGYFAMPPFDPDHVPVPRFPEMRRFKSETGEVVDGLVMEQIQDQVPQLSRFYRSRSEASAQSSDADESIRAEAFAWSCANTYLDVIEAGITQAGIVTTDRKNDTFRWDKTANRLIVMDWNQFETVDSTNIDKLERKALVSLGQYWFTLLTNLQATMLLPAWYNDDAWNHISLFGRSFIRMLINTPINLAQAQKYLGDFLRLFANGLSPEKVDAILEAGMKTEYEKWERQQRTSENPPDRLHVDDLVWTDVARHLGSPSSLREVAQKGYLEIRDSLLRVGKDIDLSLPTKSLLATLEKTRTNTVEGVKTGFAQAAHELLLFLDENASVDRKVNLKAYIDALLKRLNRLVDDLPRDAKLRAIELSDDLQRLERQYMNAIGQPLPKKLIETYVFVELYTMIGDLHSALSNGDSAAALIKIDAIRQQLTPERETAIGLTERELIDWTTQITLAITPNKKTSETAANKWFEQLVQAYTDSVQADSPDALSKYWGAARIALKAPRTPASLLPELVIYAAAAENLLRLYDIYFDIDSHWAVLHEIWRLKLRFPKLAHIDLTKTRFAVRLYTHYDKLWEQYQVELKDRRTLSISVYTLRKMAVNLQILVPDETFVQKALES